MVDQADIRHDDLEFDPTIEPKSAKAWLNLLAESEKAFEDYNAHCDNIDERYANLMRLCNHARDKEMQLFWANAEIIKPSIYAKPPVPVVTPKFKDRAAVPQAASEVMERCAVVAFDLVEIDELMKLVRDDLALLDRGVAWCRYESGSGKGYYKHEKVCIDFKNRRDFLHSVSRNWREVTWVAAASYLTRGEARKRFYKYSGDAYQDVEYKVDRDAKEVGGADNRERGKFWEIWDKTNERCVWVAAGSDKILDEDDPELDLRGFFPCPKPAYGTVQRGSLVPVPAVLQYEDQLEEINLLTGRIHALSDAVEAKGFYPAGTTEISEAIQAAVAHHSPGRVLVPISNWAAFGGTKEIIVWLPIDMIAQTITALVALRKQIIEDIYQIMGLSDIMRGATDPNETLGAQQIKTQYGSTRLRDKQQEIVRLARDLVNITADIITDKFAPNTIIEMSQTQLPTTQMRDEQLQRIRSQAQMMVQQQQMQAQQQPPAPQDGSAQPPPAQDNTAQLQKLAGDYEKASQQATIDQVLKFLGDNRAKSFVLDIETDSTIMADENAEKQRRTEFVQVLGQLLPQLGQMIAADPSTAEFCGEVIKFSTAPFRSGRSLDGAIDQLVEQMKAKGGQPRGDDPTTAQNKLQLQIEQMKNQTQKDKIKADNEQAMAKMAQDADFKQKELENARVIEQMRLQAKQREHAAKAVSENQKAMHERESHQLDMVGKQQDMQLNQQKMQLAAQTNAMRANDMHARQQERRTAQQFKMNQPPAGSRQ